MRKKSNGKGEHFRAIMSALGPIFKDRRPFLNFENPFQLLAATILSARCTDAAVNKVTPELFSRFPDAASLARAPLPELESILHPLGFFRAKARNIKAAAGLLEEKYGGGVPQTMEELCSLPGVGRKTASVLLSVCFGKPAIIVDTHFARVSRRLGLTLSERPEEIEKDIAAAAPREEWIAASGVLNRFGRTVCRAKKSGCGACPVREFCVEKRDAVKREAAVHASSRRRE